MADPMPNAPFVITVQGHAEMAHLAERGRLDIIVSHTDPNQASSTDTVVTTTQHIEALLRAYAPADRTASARQSAALAHYTKTSLTSHSHVPYTLSVRGLERRMYTTAVTLDARFRDFGALGRCATTLAALPYVRLRRVEWMLTAATERSLRADLRRAAARDALERARAYAEVVAAGELRPVQLEEGAVERHAGSEARVSYPQMQSQMQLQNPWQPEPAVQSQLQSELKSQSQSESQQVQAQLQAQLQVQMQAQARTIPSMARTAGSLEFQPQEVRLSQTVTVKFHVDLPSRAESPQQVHVFGGDRELVVL